ncbi:MAG: oxygen-independent coproporphyrinogen III oxidase [Alcanivoracaceae bacterium]|nr:oxygen-independent coproporphyrinogen III oxidase [Alcanivoracaceae bacterium]
MSNWNTDLMRRYGTQGPRYTSYPSALSFHEEVTADDYANAIAEGNDARRPLSLYLHIPFCRSVCYYCACNRVVTADHRRASEYLQRLKKEITLRASMLDTSRPMQQIHWGGGTPTYLSDAEITELVYHTARHFHMLGDDDGEYAIEIDPRTVSANRISLLRGLGFSRVSLGVQDLDPRVQQAVNRMQPYEQIRDVFDWLRDFDFRSVNTDLIYGLPWQSESSLARTIDQLVTLRPDRISLYNYAHLPARFKVQKQINELALPAPEEKLRMFARAGSMLEDAGYRLIGMDHFALPSDELAQAQEQGTLHRNFQGYTVRGDSDIIACGMSAISRVGNLYVQNWKTIDRWQADLDDNVLPLERGYLLSDDDGIRADLINRLLCDLVVDLDAFGERWQIDAQRYFADELMQLKRLEADGLVVRDGPTLTVTQQGRLLVRAVAMLFDRTFGQSAGERYSRII